MTFLILLLLALIVGIVIFVLYTLKMVNKYDFSQIIRFFKRYLYVIFTGLFLFNFIIILIAIINIHISEFIFIEVIKRIIEIIYFIIIFKFAKKLLENLTEEKIFIDENYVLTKDIGSHFIYLAVVEIVAGLVLGIFRVLANLEFFEFRLVTNTVVILYLVIGIILLIVAFILKKAIEIYKENQLTIWF